MATIGVDPETGHCTWWFFNEQHGIGKCIMTREEDGSWKLSQLSGRIHYTGLSKSVDENTIEQTVMEYSVDGEPVLQPGTKSIWKRQ